MNSHEIEKPDDSLYSDLIYYKEAASKILVEINNDGRYTPGGPKGFPKYFYIPKRTYDQLIELFQEFKITKAFQRSFLWAHITYYLKTRILFSEEIESKMEKSKYANFVKGIEFLETLNNTTITIESVEITYRAPKHSKKSKQLTSVIITNQQVIEYMQECLKIYKDVNKLSSAISELPNYENNNAVGRTATSRKQHKNFFSKEQQACAESLFGFVKRNFFKNKILTPDRQKLLFTGKFLAISGVLDIKYTLPQNEELLIDLLKKKEIINKNITEVF